MTEETAWQDALVRSRQYEKLVIHLETSLFNASDSFKCPSVSVLRTLLTLSALSPHSNNVKMICQSTHPRPLNLRAFDILARLSWLLNTVEEVRERFFFLFNNFSFSSPLIKARSRRSPQKSFNSDCESSAKLSPVTSSSDLSAKSSSDKILSHSQLDDIITEDPWKVILWAFKCSSSSSDDYQVCWNIWRPIVTLYLKTLKAFSESKPLSETLVRSALTTGGNYSDNIEVYIERVLITSKGSSGVLPVYGNEFDLDRRTVSCDILTESAYILYGPQFIKLGLESIQLRKYMLCLGFDCFSDPSLTKFIDLYVSRTTSVLVCLTYEEFLEWFTTYTASESEKAFMDLLVRKIIEEYWEAFDSLWQIDSTSNEYLQKLLELQTTAFPRISPEKGYSKSFSRYYCAAQKFTFVIGYLLDRFLTNVDNFASMQSNVLDMLSIGDEMRTKKMSEAKERFDIKESQDDGDYSFELCKLEKSIPFRYLDVE